jgi:hypothetical protein
MVKSSFFGAIQGGVEFIPKIYGSPALGDGVQGDHVPVGSVRWVSAAGDLICAAMAAFIPAIGPPALVADSGVGDGLNGLEL